jgi:aryl-alcohol dehydrogenase-like predicted oxidoreductase
VEENIGAVRVELNAEDLRQIEEESSRVKIEGARLPEFVLKMSGL